MNNHVYSFSLYIKVNTFFNFYYLTSIFICYNFIFPPKSENNQFHSLFHWCPCSLCILFCPWSSLRICILQSDFTMDGIIPSVMSGRYTHYNSQFSIKLSVNITKWLYSIIKTNSISSTQKTISIPEDVAGKLTVGISILFSFVFLKLVSFKVNEINSFHIILFD